MAMRKVTITKLSKSVQSFLARVRNGDSIIVQDEAGRARVGVIPYQEATPAQKKKAWKDVKRIQTKVGKMMRKKGKTEAQLDRILQDDE